MGCVYWDVDVDVDLSKVVGGEFSPPELEVEGHLKTGTLTRDQRSRFRNSEVFTTVKFALIVAKKNETSLL